MIPWCDPKRRRSKREPPFPIPSGICENPIRCPPVNNKAEEKVEVEVEEREGPQGVCVETGPGCSENAGVGNATATTTVENQTERSPDANCEGNPFLCVTRDPLEVKDGKVSWGPKVPLCAGEECPLPGIPGMPPTEIAECHGVECVGTGHVLENREHKALTSACPSPKVGEVSCLEG